jgi:hypothetical protein
MAGVLFVVNYSSVNYSSSNLLPSSFPSHTSVLLTIIASVVLIAVLSVTAIILRFRLYPAIMAGLVFVLLATLAPVNFVSGPSATILQVGVVVAVATVSSYALVRAAYVIWTGRRFSEALSWKYRLLLVVMIALVTLPEIRFSAGLPAISWYDLLSFPSAFEALASIVVVVAVTALMRETLIQGPGMNLTELRIRALIFAAVLFFSPTIVVHGLPVAFVTGLIILWYWVLSYSRSTSALGQFVLPNRLKKLVKASLRIRTTTRSLSKLRRSMRSKLESGEVSYQESEEKVTALDRTIGAITASVNGDAAAVTRAAFGTYRLSSAWVQAKLGAGIGLVLGLPWMIVSVAGLTQILHQQQPYGGLSFFGVASLALLRWPAYGFLYGALYPQIRGDTGLAKAANLFLATAVPQVVASLATAHLGVSVFRELTYSVSQLFVYFMMLGLAADLFTLRRVDLGVAKILELHDFRVLLAWGSSVTVAVGAAVSAALASGVTALVVAVLPSTAHTPPPAPTPTPTVVTPPAP